MRALHAALEQGANTPREDEVDVDHDTLLCTPDP
jgi:hypothetical protein